MPRQSKRQRNEEPIQKNQKAKTKSCSLPTSSSSSSSSSSFGAYCFCVQFQIFSRLFLLLLFEIHFTLLFQLLIERNDKPYGPAPIQSLSGSDPRTNQSHLQAGVLHILRHSGIFLSFSCDFLFASPDSLGKIKQVVTVCCQA